MKANKLIALDQYYPDYDPYTQLSSSDYMENGRSATKEDVLEKFSEYFASG